MFDILQGYRLWMVFCVDLCMITIAFFTSSILSMDLNQLPSISFLCNLLILQGSVFYFCGLYRGMWRFASIPDLIRILKAVLIGVIGFCLLSFSSFLNLPKNFPILYGMILILMLAGPRILYRWLKDYQFFFTNGQRVLIVGAGSAGEGIVRDMRRFSRHDYLPVVFVDDNPTKLGREIQGIRVKGCTDDIPDLVEKLKINLIIIALPSASASSMRKIVNICEQAKIPFQTLPGLKELTEGRVSINALREVSLEDLLGREQVHLAWEKIYAYNMNKNIVVTGGGGSIGSELCSQLASFAPANLIIIDNSEYNLYTIEMKLRKQYPHLNLHCLLTSITDRVAIKRIFNQFKPDLIFHAAAYKHVPLLENQLRTAMFNNIIGTRVLVEEAAINKVKTFVLISSDKAVNPTNIMGATKRASEIICQNFNFCSNTQFITVRFGNVLDSAGSVIPLFRKQLQQGGPLTVTHPEMTRFFMTIPEACQLIMQAALIGEGGEIFVLNMGEPIKIVYLAEQLIKLSGKILGEEIQIEFTGLRSGEKLYEELFYQDEELNPTLHPKIYKAKIVCSEFKLLNKWLDEIEIAIEGNNDCNLLSILQALVPEYKPLQDTKNETTQLINVETNII